MYKLKQKGKQTMTLYNAFDQYGDMGMLVGGENIKGSLEHDTSSVSANHIELSEVDAATALSDEQIAFAAATVLANNRELLKAS